jgi:hypothetical protein
VIFIALMTNSALLLLVRGFSGAVMLLLGTRYFVAFHGVDIFLYLCYKVARGDFYYWVRSTPTHDPIHASLKR